MKTVGKRTLFLCLTCMLAQASTIQFSTTGAFDATGTSTWGPMSFNAASGALPESGSLDIVLGSLSHPATGSSLGNHAGRDFSLTFSLLDTVSPVSYTFDYNITGSIYNAFGWRGTYDVFCTPSATSGSCVNGVPSIHLTYATGEGTGSFDLALRGIQNAGYPGFVTVGPGATNSIGARITNAEFTPFPAAPVPEPLSMGLTGAGLAGIAVACKRRNSVKGRK